MSRDIISKHQSENIGDFHIILQKQIPGESYFIAAPENHSWTSTTGQTDSDPNEISAFHDIEEYRDDSNNLQCASDEHNQDTYIGSTVVNNRTTFTNSIFSTVDPFVSKDTTLWQQPPITFFLEQRTTPVIPTGEENHLIISTPVQTSGGTVQITAPAGSSSHLRQLSNKSKPGSSKIWNHFTKQNSSKTSLCNYCSKVINSINATNVKRHLKMCRPDQFRAVENADEAILHKKAPLVPQNVTKRSMFSKFYTRNDPKQLLFRKKLTILAASTTITHHVIKSEEFQDLIRVADKKLRVPNWKTIRNDVSRLGDETKRTIKMMLKSVPRITISSDIWTTKGQNKSFLGVIATFFDSRVNKKIQIVLAVKQFQTVSHKAEDIIREMQSVIASYDINPGQIWRALTDGASNMICSHRVEKRIFARYENETRMQTPINVSEHHDSADEYWSDDAFRDEQTDLTELQDSGIHADNFESINIGGSGNPAYRRLTCFIHSLLLCLQNYEGCVEISSLIEKLKVIVSKFKKSHVLTESLINVTGVGLVSFCTTRWNYVYMVVARFIRVRPALETILQGLKKPKYLVTSLEWNLCEKLMEFLKPFYLYTCTNSLEKEVVSSEVIVAIISLYMHLDKYETDYEMGNYSKLIKEKMKNKFSNWFHNSENSPIEGTYVSATLLDPRYRFILPEEQRELAKRFVINEFISSQQHHNGHISSIQAPVSPTSISLTINRFPLLSDVKKLMRQNRPTPSEPIEQFKAELNRYINDETLDDLDEHSNVFTFWIGVKQQFPLLAPLALDFLSVPSSTSNVECTFSKAGNFLSKRYNLEGKNLEDEVVISKNKKVVEEFSEVMEK